MAHIPPDRMSKAKYENVDKVMVKQKKIAVKKGLIE